MCCKSQSLAFLTTPLFTRRTTHTRTSLTDPCICQAKNTVARSSDHLSLSRQGPDEKRSATLSPVRREHAKQLEAYETFLRTSPHADSDVPVFQIADGALACQWPNQNTQVVTRVQHQEVIAEYLHFLSTPEAVDVDLCRPVYIGDAGALLCQYP